MLNHAAKDKHVMSRMVLSCKIVCRRVFSNVFRGREKKNRIADRICVAVPPVDTGGAVCS